MYESAKKPDDINRFFGRPSGIKLTRRPDCSGEVNFIDVFVLLSALFSVVFVSSPVCQEHTEVVHHQTGIDLLLKEFGLFRMEIQESGSMFEVSERDFYAPPPVVAFPYIFQCERRGKVGDDILICCVRGFDLNDTERHIDEMAGIKQGLEMRDRFIGVHIAVNIFLLLHDFILFISKEPPDGDIKFVQVVGQLIFEGRKHAS